MIKYKLAYVILLVLLLCMVAHTHTVYIALYGAGLKELSCSDGAALVHASPKTAVVRKEVFSILPQNYIPFSVGDKSRTTLVI